MGINSVLNTIGISSGSINDDNFELSRRRFVMEGCIANGIYTLTAGAFLVGYSKYLGGNDQFNGIVLALPLLANAIQLFSPLLLERLENRKKLIMILCLFYRTLLAMMILIPFITEVTSIRLFLLGSMYFLAYAILGFLNPAGASWIISLVPEYMRGRYFGIRDMFLLSSAAILSLVMGRVLDVFKSHGSEFMGFVFVFCVVLVMVVLNIMVLSGIKEPKIIQMNEALKLKSLVTLPLKNKMFRKVVFLNIFWNLSVQFALPFFAVYMVTGLKLSYTFIMVMGIILSCVQAFSAKLWGAFSEKVGWEFTTVLSIGILGVVHLIWVFVNKGNYVLMIPITQILSGIGWAGVNISLFNIQFKYAPQEGRTIFVGFNAALSGVVGFASALFGSVIVGALNGVKLDIKIATLGNMPIVFGISGIMIVCCALFFGFWFKEKRH